MKRTYEQYRAALAEYGLPSVFVELDRFDQNAELMAGLANGNGKTIRVDAGALRCVALLQRVLDRGKPFQGLTAASPSEAVFLSQQGFDDILVTQPACRDLDTARVCDELLRGKRIVLTLTCPEHLDVIDRLGRDFNVVIPVCVDAHPQARCVQGGRKRCPQPKPAAVVEVCKRVQAREFTHLEGLLTCNGGASEGFMRLRDLREVREYRGAVVAAVQKACGALNVVCRAGSGRGTPPTDEPYVSEHTVGPELTGEALSPEGGGLRPLFRFGRTAVFSSRRCPQADSDAEVTVGLALEVICAGVPGRYLCRGLSGAGLDAPVAVQPAGARAMSGVASGGGLPVAYEGEEAIGLGAPVIFWATETGVLLESVNSLLLFGKSGVVDEVPTYRGEGMRF